MFLTIRRMLVVGVALILFVQASVAQASTVTISTTESGGNPNTTTFSSGAVVVVSGTASSDVTSVSVFFSSNPSKSVLANVTNGMWSVQIKAPNVQSISKDTLNAQKSNNPLVNDTESVTINPT